MGMPRPGLIEPLSAPLSGDTRASSPTSSLNGSNHDLSASAQTLPEPGSMTSRRPDTPPTPLSHLSQVDEPDFQVAAVVGVDADPSILEARRQQADVASATIAQRLLQGWTLLGVECQNPDCHAVPLMRRPSPKRANHSDQTASTSRTSHLLPDPRKVCVICERTYLSAEDLPAFEAWRASTSVGPAGTHRPPDTNPHAAHHPEIAAGPSTGSLRNPKGKKRRFTTQHEGLDSEEIRSTTRSHLPNRLVEHTSDDPQSPYTDPIPSTRIHAQGAPASAIPTALPDNTAAQALTRAAMRLSAHLDSLTQSPYGTTIEETRTWTLVVADAAESLTRVCESLRKVRKLAMDEP